MNLRLKMYFVFSSFPDHVWKFMLPRDRLISQSDVQVLILQLNMLLHHRNSHNVNCCENIGWLAKKLTEPAFLPANRAAVAE